MMNSKKWIALTAALLACVMLGTCVGASLNTSARAEETVTTTVVTSPFTAAVAKVRGSVVGVNNYQTVRYSNFGYGDYGWGNFFGFGNPYGGYGNGNGRDNQETTQEVKSATGSGVVIAKGYVLTNYHVVEDATSLKIAVLPEGVSEPVEYDATLVASDSNLDVAIVYCPNLDIEPVQLGDSDTLQVGDWAICIGNPLGDRFYGTVTTGIVSALDRSVSSSSYDRYGRRETITNTMIQTDAAINSGNSGGGMFSVTGELMGIPTLKYSGSSYTFSSADVDGIGMCIPINAAKPLINDVLSGVISTPDTASTSESEESRAAANDLTGKPRLGITIANLNPNSSAIATGVIPYGVYVREVDEGAPAAEAGMQPGDLIVEADGTIINTISQLQAVVAEHGEGDTLAIRVYRAEGMAAALEGNADLPTSGEYVDLQVTLRIVDDVRQ